MITVAGSVLKLPSFINCDELEFMNQEDSRKGSAAAIYIWATIPANQASDAYTVGDPCIVLPKIEGNHQDQSCAFGSLCALLNKTQKFLIGESIHNLDTQVNTSHFPQLYLLRPDEVIILLPIQHLSETEHQIHILLLIMLQSLQEAIPK